MAQQTAATSPLRLPRREAARLDDAWRPKRFAAFRAVVRDRSAVFGLVILAGVTLMALAANLIAPYDPTALDPTSNLAGSSREHWLGTDNLGRDIFSRMRGSISPYPMSTMRLITRKTVPMKMTKPWIIG